MSACTGRNRAIRPIEASIAIANPISTISVLAAPILASLPRHHTELGVAGTCEGSKEGSSHFRDSSLSAETGHRVRANREGDAGGGGVADIRIASALHGTGKRNGAERAEHTEGIRAILFRCVGLIARI